MAKPKRDPIPYRLRGGPDQPKRPWLQLYIGGKYVWPYYGLVDSGSDYSVIPKELARRVGVEFDETKRQEGSAAGGKNFDYFDATNQLTVMTEVGSLTLDRAMVADEEDFILGRHDFFKRYRVTFNERDQCMEIEPFDEPRDS